MKLLKDRYEFIIGFVAVIISLSAFKEELSLIRIDLGLFQFSLANYFFYLILGFVITLHIYIIPYILSFTNYSSSKLLSHIELFSYILFTLLAISTTIMLSFAFIWYIIKSIISIDPKILQTILVVLQILLSLVTIVVSVLVVKKSFKNKLDEDYDRFVSQSIVGIEESKKYYKDRLYKSAFLQAYAVIELFLRKELLRTGHMIKYSRDINLFHSAIKSKILSSDVASKIKDFILTRNTIIHSDQSSDELNANNIIQFVEKLFNNEKAI